MWRLLTDENFNRDILRGLIFQHPDLDILRIQDVQLTNADDPTILEWAIKHKRIILTHDRATMPDFAYKRILSGEDMPGLFVINDRMPVRQAIEQILLVITCSEQAEWKCRVLYLPL